MVTSIMYGVHNSLLISIKSYLLFFFQELELGYASGCWLTMIFDPPKRQKSQKISKQVVRQIFIHLRYGLLLFEGGILSQHKSAK